MLGKDKICIYLAQMHEILQEIMSNYYKMFFFFILQNLLNCMLYSNDKM